MQGSSREREQQALRAARKAVRRQRLMGPLAMLALILWMFAAMLMPSMRTELMFMLLPAMVLAFARVPGVWTGAPSYADLVSMLEAREQPAPDPIIAALTRQKT